MRRLRWMGVLLLLSCEAGGESWDVGSVESYLTPAERRARAAQIRDAAAANGITQGWLLAGIADAETQMSHCWSELTWACMGPNSPDCGGGPVVAGAGDGPCALREGGLGMFQFDAGTFEDTLEREGDRILSIDGNVAAAVDFTVAMVIRSVYVDGVETDAQAIEWMNGVRVGNGRWDAWVRTVTHYYNGCRPSFSCFDSRYEHYRSNTAGVFAEMGEDFWDIPGAGFSAAFSAQSFPLASELFPLSPGETVSGYFDMENTGTDPWTPGETFLGTTEPRDVSSPLAAADWVSANRPATVDRVVPPGEVGRFAFTVQAPDEVGDYSQFFNLVQEGVVWFSSPRDDQLQIRVQVTRACPAGLGDVWECEGAARRRCDGGMVVRENCPGGCEGGACLDAPPEDRDGDGHNTSVDCNDDDATVFPGATDPCGDGIDQNCDGIDACPGDDAGSPDAGSPDASMTPTSGGGGCAAQRAPAGAGFALLMFVLVRRRRR
ncbi:MAG: MopE-related protein [Myxococcota bacterium]